MSYPINANHLRAALHVPCVHRSADGSTPFLYSVPRRKQAAVSVQSRDIFLNIFFIFFYWVNDPRLCVPALIFNCHHARKGIIFVSRD